MPYHTPDCFYWYAVVLAAILGTEELVNFVLSYTLSKVVEYALTAEAMPAGEYDCAPFPTLCQDLIGETNLTISVNGTWLLRVRGCQIDFVYLFTFVYDEILLRILHYIFD